MERFVSLKLSLMSLPAIIRALLARAVQFHNLDCESINVLMVCSDQDVPQVDLIIHSE